MFEVLGFFNGCWLVDDVVDIVFWVFIGVILLFFDDEMGNVYKNFNVLVGDDLNDGVVVDISVLLSDFFYLGYLIVGLFYFNE